MKYVALPGHTHYRYGILFTQGEIIPLRIKLFLKALGFNMKVLKSQTSQWSEGKCFYTARANVLLSDEGISEL